MASITIDLPDELLLKVMQAGLAEGRSLNDHVIATLVASLAPTSVNVKGASVAATVTVDDVIERSIKHVTPLMAGSEFFLNNVCSVDDWESLDAGQRKSLGKKFRLKMKELGLAEWKGRSGNNHALYVRSGETPSQTPSKS